MSSAVSPSTALSTPLPLAIEPSLPPIKDKDLFDTAVKPVRHDLAEVEVFLRSHLRSKVEGVPEMMAYLIESGGKRVRPLVTCLAARACGYAGKDHVPIACVAELLHTATLYHDDVVDGAEVRRGRPTANRIFGNKVIVLAGDLMLAHSYSMLMDGGYFLISQRLSHTVRQMVEGEILQLQREGDFESNINQYFDIISNKTASLFSWCGRAAAMLADKSDSICEAMSQFGYHMGVAFQLVDDLMDFTGEEEQTGKTLFQDLFAGKITLPLILLLQKNPELKSQLSCEYKRLSAIPENQWFAELQTSPVVHQIKEFVGKTEIFRQHQTYVVKAIEQARDALSILPVSTYRTALFSLLEYLSRRDR